LRLEPRVPCPVCGSPEHPTHADSALADLAAELRADLAAARAAGENARDEQAAALRAQDRAHGELELAGKNAQTAEAKISSALAHWQDAYNRALAVPNCPALPKEPGEDCLNLLALLETTETARQAEATAQVELSRLRSTLASTISQREDLRKIIAGHTSARETWNSELANATSLQMLDLRAAE